MNIPDHLEILLKMFYLPSSLPASSSNAPITPSGLPFSKDIQHPEQGTSTEDQLHCSK